MNRKRRTLCNLRDAWGMNVLYDPLRIGIKTSKKLTPLDRIRLRELRYDLRGLWNPERSNEIRAWQKRAGINSDRGIKQFAHMNREEKEKFFDTAQSFVREMREEICKRIRKKRNHHFSPLQEALHVLGLNKDASSDSLRHRFHELVFHHHPDYGGDTDKFIEIHRAYIFLKNNWKKE